MNQSTQLLEEVQQPSCRRRGEGRIWRRRRIWWIKYYVHGRPVCESSHSDRRAVAERLLRQRLGEAAAGIAAPPRAARVSYEEIRDALLADYTVNKRKWIQEGKDGNPYMTAHLDRFFSGYRAVNIATDAIREFVRKRQEEGAASGTINRSLALLRRMFRLAVQDRKLHDVPHFPMLKEGGAAEGVSRIRRLPKTAAGTARVSAACYDNGILHWNAPGRDSRLALGQCRFLRWRNQARSGHDKE